MNWVTSSVFLLIIFLIYNLIGNVCLKLVGYEEIDCEKRILSGFICTFFLSFLIGVPCQLLHTHWKVFKYILLIALVILIILCVYLEKNNIKIFLLEFRKQPIDIIKNNIKEYWFVYLLVILFSILSMSNTLPYYKMNYDDSYYIGKIINQVGAPALSVENIYNGNFIGSFDGDITRILNTFEISYGFFAELFNISIPFFCRVPITIHNYLLMFLCYKSVGKLFVKKSMSQYVILPFSILLISSGYLMESPNNEFLIRMYDGWQLQTAIFYGGSIVRTMSIPILIIFGIELIRKIELKKLVYVAVIYLVFMSFSTIFLTYAIFLTFTFFVIKAIYCFNQYHINNNKKVIYVGLIIIIMFIGLLLTRKLDRLSIINTETYANNVNEYINFYNHYFKADTFVYYAPFILMSCYFVFKNYRQKASVLLVLIPYIIFYSNKFIEIIIVATINNFFVALRFITSIQMMIILFLGICVVKIIDSLKRKKVILPIISLSTVLVVSCFIYNNKNYIYEQDFLGSGITRRGYSIEQIFRNQEMMPDIMVEIGEYFDNLDYGNYSLVLPAEVSFDKTTIPSSGFLITSNRIELCSHNGCKNMTDKEYDKINKYFENQVEYEEVDSILQEHRIKYILVTDEKQKQELENNNFEIVLSNKNKNKYFLLKSPY
ncbi:DUF6077 domain-containing protein [Thomasclavelia cocleata]|uniref:DUF6077 domain-containing protein n=1 Tax=Thomasclavelia cocleata TaxID=69824 RepID=UPI002557DB72|nr:DUF6077 domain-containing protein [Thomasclavelia cocleata]